MRLVSFKTDGKINTGVEIAPDQFVSVRDLLGREGPEAYDMVALIEAGEALLNSLRGAVQRGGARTFKGGDIELLPPVLRPSKMPCVPNNNTAFQHTIVKGPEEVTWFFKPASALAGHGAPIVIRRDYGITYPEPELGVVIGKVTKDVTPTQAMDHVFGYTIHNDVTSATMRGQDTFHYQEGMPDTEGKIRLVESHASYAGRYKGADTFAPLGPAIVTKDEIPDPHSLDVECWIAGQLWYSDNTRNLTYYVPDVVARMSRFITLNPGDIVSMGTASDPGGETGNVPQSVTDLAKLGGPVEIRTSVIGILRNPVHLVE